jgi:salicylate hydroxylase
MASADSGTTKPFHVAIVGGGIGGLAFAIGLLQYSSHITFHIYEAAPAFAEIGAGVGFGNNSHKAIKLISPELWERYNSRATFNGWESKAHTWFDFQVGEKGENEGKRILEVQMEGRETQSTVHRAHFLEELISFIPRGAASFGKRCVGIEQPEGEQVIIKFADGSDARADAVVGCDGVRSAVRPLVLGVDNPSTMPVFTQKYAYRGLIPMDKLVEAVGDEKAKNRQMYLGHNAHILTFPIAKCTLANVVAFHGMKGEGEGWTGEWVKPNQKENMMNDFADFGVLPSKILGVSTI